MGQDWSGHLIRSYNDIFLTKVELTPTSQVYNYVIKKYNGTNYMSVATITCPNLTSAKLVKKDNEIFFFIGEGGTPEEPAEDCYINFGKIVGTMAYHYRALLPTTLYEDAFDLTFVTKNFNLYNYIVITTNKCYKTQQVYNEFNYNSLPNSDNWQLLLPNSIQINKVGETEILFARNLYNKIVDNQETISTFEIPASQMNNYEQNNLDYHLISYTNTGIIDEERQINKNKYENILINFINLIRMQDRNGFGRRINNVAGAIRVNKSISEIIDCNETKATKYKIVYSNNTEEIKTIADNQITIQTDNRNRKYAMYIFELYNPAENLIKEIQIISNDEQTSYLTIDFTNKSGGKVYKINQKLEVR